MTPRVIVPTYNEHDSIGPVTLDTEQGLEPVRGLKDVEAGVPKGLHEHLSDIRVVVRNQHSHENPLLDLPARLGRRGPSPATACSARYRPAPRLKSRTRRGP